MNPIGGFFALELPHEGPRVHPRASALSTGRACLMAMLGQLRPRRVYVPYYTCDATLAPFARLGIETRSYGLREDLFPAPLPALEDGEYLLWTDYFGICEHHTRQLKQAYGERLLIDDTHNFFRQGHEGHWSFTSARKYFGVPDGAFLYAPRVMSLAPPRFDAPSLTHGLLRTLGRDKEAYAAYRAYEESLGCELEAISVVSEGLLRGVDLPAVMAARRANFAFLHEALGGRNRLAITPGEQVAFCYPYLPQLPIERQVLHEMGFFIPCLWPEVAARAQAGYAWERRFSAELLPLPIDHRYTPRDLGRLVQFLQEHA